MKKALMINFGLRCNFSCKYCYLKGKEQLPIIDDTISGLKKVVSNNKDITFLNILGGEPLLENEKLIDFLNFIKEINFNREEKDKVFICITTNGSIYLEHIKDFKDFLSLNISIDGGEKSQNKNRIFKNGDGTYKTCIEVINKYSKDGIIIGIHSVIKNPFLWKKCVSQLFKDLNNVEYTYSFNWDIQGGSAILELLNKAYVLSIGVKEMKKYNINFDFSVARHEEKLCGGSYTFLVIDYDSKIYSCETKSSGTLIGEMKDGDIEIDMSNKYVLDKHIIDNYNIHYMSKKLSKNFIKNLKTYICNYRNEQITNNKFTIPFRDVVYSFILSTFFKDFLKEGNHV